jgi:hypothetical protein
MFNSLNRKEQRFCRETTLAYLNKSSTEAGIIRELISLLAKQQTEIERVEGLNQNQSEIILDLQCNGNKLPVGEES